MKSFGALLAGLLLAQVVGAQNVCTGQSEGAVVCVDGTRFTICANQAQTPLQSCGGGTACCSGVCANPTDPICGDALCKGIAEGGQVCTSSNAFSYCQSGRLTPQQGCAPGTVCCGNSCVLSSDPSCSAPAPPVTTTVAPVVPTTTVVIAPTTTVAPVPTTTVAPVPTTTIAPLPTTAPAPPPADCSTAEEGAAVCVSATSFDRCISGRAINAVQPCALGTFCCAGTCAGLTDDICVAFPPLGTAPVTTTAAAVVPPVATTTVAPVIPILPVTPVSPVTPGTSVFGSCLGAQENSIVCVTSTSFNFCQNQGIASSPAITCAPGTVCCAATNRCDYATNCPVNSTPCTGQPDASQKCIDSTRFTLCSAGEPTPFQTCAPGTVCCNNACVGPTSPACAGVVIPPPVTTTVANVVPPVATTTQVPLPPANGVAGTCTGISDNNIACTSSITFNFCINQAFVNAPNQNCAPGTVCCADSNRCDFIGNCKAVLPPPTNAGPTTTAASIVPGSCAGIADDGIICTSYNSIGWCRGGALQVATQQYCAPGTVCCADTNTCDFASNCKTLLPTLTAALPVFTNVPPAILPSVLTCAGLENQRTACVSGTQFNFCKNGAFIADAPQTCATGTVCCADSGRCDFASNCKLALPGGQPAPGVPVVTNPVTPVNPVLGSCQGAADNSIVCTSATQFNYCLNGAFVNAPSQSCSGGTVCCANTNKCDYSYNCGTVLPASCVGVPTGNPVCIGPMTFNYCVNGAFINNPPQSCASGTVCCADTNRCDFPSNCGSVLPPQLGGGTTTAVPIATTTAPVNPIVTTTNAAGPAPTVIPGSCQGVADNNIVCTSATTFNFCSNGVFVNAPSQSCAGGTVCCADKNVCDLASNCGKTLPPVCSGKADGAPVCLSRNTFNYCRNGNFVTDLPQSCGAGTVCCAETGRCAFENECTSVLNRPFAPAEFIQNILQFAANTPTSSSVSICAGIEDNALACMSPSTYAICGGGLAITGALPVAPGTKCCQNRIVVASAPECSLPQICTGRSDGMVCTSNTQYTVCLNNVAIVAPMPCAPGTSCCNNQCVIGECSSPINPITPPTPTNPVPVPVPSLPLNSCDGVPDYGSTCSGFYTFKYCLAGSLIPRQVDQYCGFTLSGKALACCPDGTQASCKEAKYCKSLIGVPPPQPPKPEDPPGVCKNVEDDDQVCIDNVRYSICRSENPFLSASCGEGTICCKKNGQCLTSRQCSGEAVEIVKPVNPCSFSVDGWDTCSDNNLAVFTCKNKEVDIIRECGAGTKCCPFTRSCVTEDQCKDPCLSRADNALVCQDLYTFGICRNQRIGGTLGCYSGSVCCRRTQSCDEPKNC